MHGCCHFLLLLFCNHCHIRSLFNLVLDNPATLFIIAIVMSDEAIVKRLKVIVKEHGGQLALAGAIGVDQGFISKVINKKQDVSYYLIRKLCFQLKYSPEWLILGTGEKKIDKPESAKLITEIQMMRS